MDSIKIDNVYYYSEDYMDYYMKINIALIEKFKEQLSAEYGSTIQDINQMFLTLYREQNKIMPDKWYYYTCGLKGE